MKKILMAVIATALSIAGAHAQTTDKVKVGMRLDWDLTIPSTNIPTLKNGSGGEAGVLVNVPVYNGLYVEPSVNYYFNTMDVSYIDFVVNGHDPGPDGVIRNMGIRVPVAVGYKFNLTDGISMSVFTGPQFNFGTSTKAHYDAEDLIADMHATIDLGKRGWRKFDTQWLVGIRFHYLDNFFADIYGGIGMTNILDDNMAKTNHLRRNTFSMGVGYMF